MTFTRSKGKEGDVEIIAQICQFHKRPEAASIVDLR